MTESNHEGNAQFGGSIGIPKYDPKAALEIGEEMGIQDPNGCVRVAATEMDGARQGKWGIDSTQTACQVLNYEEGVVPESLGERDGRDACLDALSKHAGENIRTDEEADRYIERWLRGAERG